MPNSDDHRGRLRPHMFVLGGTRTGKTFRVGVPLIRRIAAQHASNQMIIVIDAKGSRWFELGCGEDPE